MRQAATILFLCVSVIHAITELSFADERKLRIEDIDMELWTTDPQLYTSNLDWACKYFDPGRSAFIDEEKIQTECEKDRLCYGGIFMSLSAVSDNIFRYDGSGSLSFDGVNPQYNAINLGFSSRRDFDINEAEKSLFTSKAGSINVGVAITVRPDYAILRKFVESGALDELDSRIHKQRIKRLPGVRQQGLDELYRQVDTEIDRRIAGLRNEIENSPAFIGAIQAERDRETARIRTEIDQGIASNPSIQSLPEPFRTEQADLLRAELLASSLADLETQLASNAETTLNELVRQGTEELEIRREAEKNDRSPEAIAAAEAILERRLQESRRAFARRIKEVSDRFVKEGTIDQFALGVSKVFDNGKGVVSVRVGKLIMDNGQRRNGRGQTLGERVSGLNNPFERAGGSANTFGLAADTVFAITETSTLQLGGNIFHNRMPSPDGRSSLSNLLFVLGKDDNEVTHQQDYFNLDSYSGFARADISGADLGLEGEVRSIAAYASAGQYSGDFVGTVGGEIHFNGGFSALGSFTNGNQPYAKNAWTLQGSYEVTEGSNVFLRYSDADYMLRRGEREEDISEVGGGASITLYNSCETISLMCTQVRANAAVDYDLSGHRRDNRLGGFSLTGGLTAVSKF